MKSFKYYMGISLLALGFGLTACGDDDENSGNPGNIQLNNQIACKENVVEVKSALRFDEGSSAQFYLSPTAGLTDVAAMRQANDYLLVSLPASQLGAQNDFGNPGMFASYRDVTVTAGSQAAGLLDVKVSGDNMELNLHAEGAYSIDCQYKGAFVHQLAQNRYQVTNLDGTVIRKDVLSAFSAPAEHSEEAVTFILGEIDSKVPNELTLGNYAIMFSVPLAEMDGRYHAYQPIKGYTCCLIDNQSSIYHEKVATGRFRVVKEEAGVMCLEYEFSLQNGIRVKGDYRGEVKEVMDIDIRPVMNRYVYKNAYSETPEEHDIIEVLYKVNDKGEQVFGFKYNQYQEFNGYPPLVEIYVKDENLMGKGKLDLALTPGWEVRCGSLQAMYVAPDDPNAQWKQRGKGYISVMKIGEKYRFSLKVETVPFSQWQKPEMLELTFEGPVTVVE